MRFLLLLAFFIAWPTVAMTDEPRRPPMPYCVVAIFTDGESTVISCHSGTPLALATALANAIETSSGTKATLDITPGFSFRPLSNASTWTLLHLTNDGSKICFSSNVCWGAIPNVVEVVESFGYSGDVRLAHLSELVTMDDATQWDWSVPHIATKDGEP